MNTNGKTENVYYRFAPCGGVKRCAMHTEGFPMLFVLMKLSVVISILNHHWYVQEIAQLNITIFGLKMQKIIEDG